MGTWNCSAPNAGDSASSPPEGYVSWDFSSCCKNLGFSLELQRGWSFENLLSSAKSGLLSSSDGNLRNLNSVWQDNRDASGGEVGDQVSLSNLHRDIVIPINFQEVSGLGTFEALNSVGLSRCQGI